MIESNSKSCNQQTQKELPDKNIEHDFRPEKAKLQKPAQNNCQSCNDLKNEI